MNWAASPGDARCRGTGGQCGQGEGHVGGAKLTVTCRGETQIPPRPSPRQPSLVT